MPLKNYIESVENAYNFLNNFLKDTEWITGDTITIADLSLLASVTSLNEIFEISEKYANLLKWIRLSECQVWYAANENGLNQLKSILCKQSIKCNNLIK